MWPSEPSHQSLNRLTVRTTMLNAEVCKEEPSVIIIGSPIVPSAQIYRGFFMSEQNQTITPDSSMQVKSELLSNINDLQRSGGQITPRTKTGKPAGLWNPKFPLIIYHKICSSTYRSLLADKTKQRPWVLLDFHQAKAL